MNYSKISREGMKLLTVLIDNDENGISTDQSIVENLLNNFTILSAATEKVARQNQRENQAFQELLSRTSLLIVHLGKELESLTLLIEKSKGKINVNEEIKKQAQKELNDINRRILATKKEIEKLKPRLDFQWWWIFCWWCGLAAAGIQNAINAKFADIEKLQLQADLLTATIVNESIGDYNKTIQKLQKKLAADRAVFQTSKEKQDELVIKAELFADKTASTGHLEREINLIRDNLQDLYDNKDLMYLQPATLNTVVSFCDGKTHQDMPMSKILSGWGEILNEELNPSGASVQAVRLAIDGKEFGHLTKISASHWEFVGTSKFDDYKDDPIAKILVNGPFKETGRDQWSIAIENNSQWVGIDIWTKTLTTTNKSTKQKFKTEIIDGSLAEEVHFYGEAGISQAAVAKKCLEKNWRLASEFELTIAWVHHGFHTFAFGQLRDNLLAVPIQTDQGETFKKGLNIMPFGSKDSGNQGFFYIEKKIMTFRKLYPSK